MAGRAIAGIGLGIVFLPLLALLMTGFGISQFATQLFSGQFIDAMAMYATAGINSMIAPLFGANHVSVIEGLGADPLFMWGFFTFFSGALVIWAVAGLWAGAIERSPTRGLLVGLGIWLGWLIITLIFWFVNPVFMSIPGNDFQTMMVFALDPMFYSGGAAIGIIDLLLAQILTLIVVVVVAALAGAITKSEEF